MGKMYVQHASVAEALPTVVGGKTVLSDDDKHTAPIVKNDVLEAIANVFVESIYGQRRKHICA
jgi:hypothetical protein